MNLVRSAPRRSLTRFHDAFDDLFSRFLGDWDVAGDGGAWMPALDISENDDEIVVEAELPGVDPEDLDVSVQGNTLTLTGEKRESVDEREKGYHHVERRYGRFSRSIPLPSNVDAENIQAASHDGVLKVTLPKSESAKPRKIDVKSK